MLTKNVDKTKIYNVKNYLNFNQYFFLKKHRFFFWTFLSKMHNFYHC